MNREEFIGKLQMVYVGDRNAFNEIISVYDNLIHQLEVSEQKRLKALEYVREEISSIMKTRNENGDSGYLFGLQEAYESMLDKLGDEINDYISRL